jgi:hypothetical protein
MSNWEQALRRDNGMSWSASAVGTKRELQWLGPEAPGLIYTTPPSPTVIDEHMAKQHAAARVVALQLIEFIPGPKLSVTMNGHANGVGDVEKPGWANDYITVTVTQVTT